jgi:hypothetical protein
MLRIERRGLRRVGIEEAHRELRQLLLNALLRHFRGKETRTGVTALVHELTSRELTVLARAFLLLRFSR